jgi:hypothetical protein
MLKQLMLSSKNGGFAFRFPPFYKTMAELAAIKGSELVINYYFPFQLDSYHVMEMDDIRQKLIRIAGKCGIKSNIFNGNLIINYNDILNKNRKILVNNNKAKASTMDRYNKLIDDFQQMIIEYNEK